METLYARDYRRIASEKCAKFSSRLAIIFLVYSILSGLGGIISFEVGELYGVKIEYNLSGLVMLIIGGPLMVGLAMISRKVYCREEPQVDDLFSGFKDFGNNLVLHLLISIYTALWTLLFIIPGIIKGIAYSMAYYIKEENPSLSANECITRSKEMMDGHKWELFCLHLSYLGWYILSIFTLGILLFWIEPKVHVAQYTFYRNISGKCVSTISNLMEDEDFIIKVE